VLHDRQGGCVILCQFLWTIHDIGMSGDRYPGNLPVFSGDDHIGLIRTGQGSLNGVIEQRLTTHHLNIFSWYAF